MSTKKNKTQHPAIDRMIKARAILAPLSGITDIPFRMMAREFGCAYAFTEMIDVNGIAYGNRKTFRLMERFPQEGPLGVQLVGEDVDRLIKAAVICEEKGFEVLDVNAGCPARKVVKGGKGAALLRDPAKLARIVRGLVKNIRIPVTVKIRSGWDAENLNYLEVAKAVVGEGAAAIGIHSRTKAEMYKGRANREIIRDLKNKITVPVFASGGIFSADDVVDVFKETGCDAVFVARGALGRPWIFSQINNRLLNGAPPEEMTFDRIKDVIARHFSLCLQFGGEKTAMRRMHKHLMWYLKGFKNCYTVMAEYRRMREEGVVFEEFMKRLHVDEHNCLSLELTRKEGTI